MTVNQIHKDDIEQKIMVIIADKITANKELLEPSASLCQLGIDSLDLVEIVLEIEYSFQCLIDDAKIEELETVAEIIDYVYVICKQ
jgi:acyl carrier protein